MKKETLKKYIGLTNGVLTALELSYETYDEIKQVKRTYLKCKCSRCGKCSDVRAERLRFNKNYYPKSCTYCVTSLQKEIAEKKYKIIDTKRIRNRISSIKNQAKSRNLDMKLTDDEIKSYINKKCYYCNDSFSTGIDRISSNIGYFKENCVPCCHMCNMMKNKYNIEVFLDKIEKIYNNFHNKSSTTIPRGSTP